MLYSSYSVYYAYKNPNLNIEYKKDSHFYPCHNISRISDAFTKTDAALFWKGRSVLYVCTPPFGRSAFKWNRNEHIIFKLDATMAKN